MTASMSEGSQSRNGFENTKRDGKEGAQRQSPAVVININVDCIAEYFRDYLT